VYACVSCKRKSPEPNGVGDYQFGKTVLGDIDGKKTRCNPAGDYMLCMGQALPATKIGAQPANTDLYFKGNDPKAPLVEIALTIRACNTDDAGKALTTVLGKPDQDSNAKRMFWSGKIMFASAKLPAKDSIECQVNFILATDADRMKELKAE
jgi:hypothetical protein